MTATAEPETTDTKPATAWTTLPVADLELPMALAEFLAEAGIATLGVLHDRLFDGSLDEELGAKQRDALREAVNLVAEQDPDYTPLEMVAEAEEAARLAEYDIETARIISEEERKVSALEAQWEALHTEASIAKKQFEAARDDMRDMIRERTYKRGQPPERTLFDGVKDDEPETPAGTVPEDLWRQFPLARFTQFGLTDKDIEKLAAGETKSHGTHPLIVLGDVTRFITPDASNPAYARTLKDVKGFGDAAMERWTDAETKFWDWWRNKGGEREFAIEKGVLTDADATPAGDGGEGAGGGEAGPDAEAADGTDAPGPKPEEPPAKLRTNPKTGELEPVGDEGPKKGKRKAK